MGKFKTRITKVTVTPGELFHERGFEVEIVDEAGGEFIQVRSNDAGGVLRFDIDEWPALCVAIDDMVREIKENKEKPEPPKEEEGGWIPWNGGECPVHPETIVLARLRGNACDKHPPVVREFAEDLWWWHSPVGNPNHNYDIIAYKVVEIDE